jgi:hypothetical protein
MAHAQEHRFVSFDPLLGEREAENMVRLCERFGRYGMYSQEDVASDIGRGLPQRIDAIRNFLRTGGRSHSDEPVKVLAARTNYFREEYAYGQQALIDGIEPYLNHEGFVEAAREVHEGRPVIEPAIVFANLMVPGQELAVHTDVPEFRGCNRKVMPQWLLVAMHHSGLFASWRMPIATGVAWYHDCDGGEFAFWPGGPDGDAVAHKVAYDTAIVLDADSVFHGVDRVAPARTDLAPLRPGMTLDFVADGEWALHEGDGEVARFEWRELRFSVSWKGYCFADEHEQRTWRDHGDDLTMERVIATFVDDLRARDVIAGDVEVGPDLALTIIDEYIRFPGAEAA